MISFKNVYKYYGEHEVLTNINLELNEKEFVCLVGESGSGKTTALKVLAGLEPYQSGEILIEGKKLAGTNFDVSMVFQSGALMPWLTVQQNIELPFKLNHLSIDGSEILKVIAEVGLKGYENIYPRILSGGQKQRVGLARALAVRRKILLLDEPFSALDIKTAAELRADLMNIWRQNDLTVFMVSHLVEEAVELSDKIVVMKEAKIVSKLTIDLARPRIIENKEFLEVVDHIKDMIEA